MTTTASGVNPARLVGPRSRDRDMCQRTAGAKCQAACTGDGAWEKKREASAN